MYQGQYLQSTDWCLFFCTIGLALQCLTSLILEELGCQVLASLLQAIWFRFPWSARSAGLAHLPFGFQNRTDIFQLLFYILLFSLLVVSSFLQVYVFFNPLSTIWLEIQEGTEVNAKYPILWAEQEYCSLNLSVRLLLCTCMCSQSLIMSDSLQPHVLQPIKLLCPWDFPGKDAGVGYHTLLQGIFLTLGSNPCLLRLLHWQADSLHHLKVPPVCIGCIAIFYIGYNFS